MLRSPCDSPPPVHRSRSARARCTKTRTQASPGSLESTVAAIEAVGGHAYPVVADLADPDSRARVVPTVEQALGPIDVLVNNAAIAWYGNVEDLTRQRARLLMELDYHAPVELTQAALPAMRARRTGWIVNVSSVLARHPEPAPFTHVLPMTRVGWHYGAVKAALERFTTGLATEVYDDRIAVNALLPVARCPPSVTNRNLLPVHSADAASQDTDQRDPSTARGPRVHVARTHAGAPLPRRPDARLAEQIGYEAGYVSGGALGFSLAVSEALLSIDELADLTRAIAGRCDLPIVVDGGVGFGDPVHVTRTMWELEAAGAAAVEIEDQVAPKRVSHHRGVEHLVSRDEMVSKVTAAVAARQDPNFLVIVRTGAVRHEGVDAACDRAAPTSMPAPMCCWCRSPPPTTRSPRSAPWSTYRSRPSPPSITTLDDLAPGIGLYFDPLTPHVATYRATKDLLERHHRGEPTGIDADGGHDALPRARDDRRLRGALRHRTRHHRARHVAARRGHDQASASARPPRRMRPGVLPVHVAVGEQHLVR